jgi:hypothetical protein
MSSQVTLNGIALDIDPEEYVPLGGRRRGSVFRLIDGGTVYQDRGISASDLVIQVVGRITNVTTLKSLYALYRKAATTFTFIDFKGNQFTVIFTPGQESFVVSPIRGSNIGYDYRMLLSVVSVEKWFGDIGGFPSST